MFGQSPQFALFGSEGLGDDPLYRAMQTGVGNGVEPVDQLDVDILEVAEAAGQEEVLPDIAERPLDLALGFGPIGTAGPRLEPVMRGQRQQRAVLDDVSQPIFAGHRGLHAVVKDLDRDPAERVKGLHVAAQQGLQILVHHIVSMSL